MCITLFSQTGNTSGDSVSGAICPVPSDHSKMGNGKGGNYTCSHRINKIEVESGSQKKGIKKARKKVKGKRRGLKISKRKEKRKEQVKERNDKIIDYYRSERMRTLLWYSDTGMPKDICVKTEKKDDLTQRVKGRKGRKGPKVGRYTDFAR